MTTRASAGSGQAALCCRKANSNGLAGIGTLHREDNMIRLTLNIVTALLCASSAAWAGEPAASDVPTYARVCEPVVKPAFLPLPIGAVQPQGWLRDWAQSARDGITGHLDEWHPAFADGWKGIPIQCARRQARWHRMAARTIGLLARRGPPPGPGPPRRDARQEDPRPLGPRRGGSQQSGSRHLVRLLEKELQTARLRQLGAFANGPRAGGLVSRHRRQAGT